MKLSKLAKQKLKAHPHEPIRTQTLTMKDGEIASPSTSDEGEIESSTAVRDQGMEKILVMLQSLSARLATLEQLAGANVKIPPVRPEVGIEQPVGVSVEAGPKQLLQPNPLIIQCGPNFDTEMHQRGQGQERLERLEEALRALQCPNSREALDFSAMCLIPNVEIPRDFKVPDFDKYLGTTCPKSHLTKYCRRMTAYQHNERLLMHVFQESLSGSAEHWYNTLDSVHIRSWRDMADSFVRHYAHNTYIAPTREDLKKMEKENVENLRTYALRWRELAAQVQPPLSEKEMANTFINTLKGALLSNLLPHLNSNFAEVVSAGENIEGLLEDKRIVDPQAILVMVEQLSKKAGPRKKDDEVDEIQFTGQTSQDTQINHPPPNNYFKNLTFPAPVNYQAPYRAPYPQQNHTFAPPQYNQNQYQAPPPSQMNYAGLRPQSRPTYNFPQKPPKQYTTLPVPMDQLFEQLTAENKIMRRPARTWDFRPTWFDGNRVCVFHSGERGHDIFRCPALRDTVEGLIQQGSLKFAPLGGPNIVLNPSSGH
jgi:hypothetical protein